MTKCVVVVVLVGDRAGADVDVVEDVELAVVLDVLDGVEMSISL